MLGNRKTRSELVPVLSDLTLRVPKGKTVGVIGRNGSGKSTLLKLLTGIYKPDKGSIKVKGRVAALIELGAGFHPDFTGRENVYLSGVMYGLSRKEIDNCFSDIVAFAELEKVIDDPVRTYSSGMFMRLGFSLAIHVDPDILLIDEVLAVGDAGFVAKCKEKIDQLKNSGKTLLLVSHDLEAVERWCDEVLWLHHGEVFSRGTPRKIIDEYRSFIEKGEEEQLLSQVETENKKARSVLESEELDVFKQERWGSREVELLGVDLKNPKGESHLLFHPEDQVLIEIDYRSNEPQKDCVFGVAIRRADGLMLLGTNTHLERIDLDAIQTSGKITYKMKRLGLLEGHYSLDIAVHKEDGYPFDYIKNAIQFKVRDPMRRVGVLAPDNEWLKD